MTEVPSRPWAGITLALIGGAAMFASGADWWLTMGIVVLWIASLLLLRPEPVVEYAASDPSEIAETARETLLEAIGVPLILIERERIAGANSPARAVLGTHILGQDTRIALRHPDAMRLLDADADDSVTIAGFAGVRTLWQLTRRQIDPATFLIELVDRTSEADVSRAHTDFVANASHELRTPLATIIGYVETLEDAGATMDEATREKFHRTLLREAQRMQTLVADLMSLSQVEAEKHDLPNDELDLVRLAERVVGEVVAIAGKERVVIAGPGDAIRVRGDRAQLEQLVRNLVDNALKYGDSVRPVEVSVAPGQFGGAVLTVTDHGPGIAPEHLPHLTRRFYRTDPGRSRAAGGTGLGLAIVKHIVERHRGRLDIASEVGVGTAFTVTLPVHPGAPAALS